MEQLKRNAFILPLLLMGDIAYIAWVFYYMDEVYGWATLVVFVFLLPPGVFAGFAILAKIIAELRGKPIKWITALGIGFLGIAASFVLLMVYTALLEF